MSEENRRFIRFAVTDDTFAALWPSFIKVGKIMDISIDGLGFEYITYGQTDGSVAYVSIFVRDETVHIKKIPCTIVYDDLIDITNFKARAGGNLKRKRCGLRFGKLNKDYKFRLEKFLENHTVGIFKDIAVGR